MVSRIEPVTGAELRQLPEQPHEDQRKPGSQRSKRGKRQPHWKIIQFPAVRQSIMTPRPLLKWIKSLVRTSSIIHIDDPDHI